MNLLLETSSHINFFNAATQFENIVCCKILAALIKYFDGTYSSNIYELSSVISFVRQQQTLKLSSAVDF